MGTAVIFGDDEISYADLDRRANRVAHLLAARGIGAGDSVALSCPNVPYFVDIFWGVRKLGAELVAIDISHHPEEVAERAAGARAHLAFESLGSLMIGEIAWAAHDGQREFFLITLDTGFPEPLEPPEFYHPLIARQPDDGFDPIPAGDPTDERWLLLLPLSESSARETLVEAAQAGAAVVLVPHLNQALIDRTIERARVTRTIG